VDVHRRRFLKRITDTQVLEALDVSEALSLGSDLLIQLLLVGSDCLNVIDLNAMGQSCMTINEILQKKRDLLWLLLAMDGVKQMERRID
jgi:hypothetical protein